MGKNTQKTEDMLDQTFANFDSQVTGIEEEVSSGANSNGSPVKAKSGNTSLFIAGGVLAVGVAAYLYISKSGMLGGAPAPQQQVAQAQVQPQPTPAQTNVAPAVNPLAQENGQVPTVPGVDASGQPVVPAVPGLDTASVPSVPPAPTLPSVESTLPAIPTVPTVPNLEASAPSVSPTVPSVPAEVASAIAQNSPTVESTPTLPTDNTPIVAQGSSVMVAKELQDLFDKQSQEFKSELSGLDSRVNAVEGMLNEQKSINQKVDERLTKLETGSVNVRGSNKAIAKSEAKSETKPDVVVKKSKVVKPKAKVANKPKAVKKEVVKEEDDSILVDKSEEIISEKKTKITKEKQAPKLDNLPSINVHSIYGGRVWVKNSDGSLSTYSVGDTLPTGEKIRQINDEKYQIITDKRSI